MHQGGLSYIREDAAIATNFDPQEILGNIQTASLYD